MISKDSNKTARRVRFSQTTGLENDEMCFSQKETECNCSVYEKHIFYHVQDQYFEEF